MPLGLSLNELLGRARWCTVMPSCSGEEHTPGDAPHRLPKDGCCASGRDEVSARTTQASSRSSPAAQPTAAAAMMRPAMVMSWMGEPAVCRPPRDGRPAPVADLGNWTGGSGQVQALPANAAGRERNRSGGASFATDGRSAHADDLGSTTVSPRVSSAAMTKREDFANCCILCGLTFEVRRARRQATRSGEYQGRGAWPAVGPRLDRVVRPHQVMHGEVLVSWGRACAGRCRASAAEERRLRLGTR